ncbi:MAG: hypothetical protein WBW16_12750 [Bacteroidota bacterium]
MQVPVEWHVYIIPGFMYVACLFFLCPGALRQELKEWLVDKPIGLLAITLLSFLAGVASNYVLINVIRPVAVCLGWLDKPVALDELALSQANPDQAQLLKNAYLSMLFPRSLVPALFLSLLFWLPPVWRAKFENTARTRRIIFKLMITVLSVALPLIFLLQYKNSKTAFEDLKTAEIQSLSSGNTVRQPTSTNR